MQEQSGESELFEAPLRRRPHRHRAEISFDKGAKLRRIQSARVEVVSRSCHVERLGIETNTASHH
jgi:hypothetical protein